MRAGAHTRVVSCKFACARPTLARYWRRQARRSARSGGQRLKAAYTRRHDPAAATVAVEAYAGAARETLLSVVSS